MPFVQPAAWSWDPGAGQGLDFHCSESPGRGPLYLPVCPTPPWGSPQRTLNPDEVILRLTEARTWTSSSEHIWFPI